MVQGTASPQLQQWGSVGRQTRPASARCSSWPSHPKDKPVECPGLKGRRGSRRLARLRPLARPCGPCSRCAWSIPCAASQAAQVSRLETCASPGIPTYN